MPGRGQQIERQGRRQRPHRNSGPPPHQEHDSQHGRRNHGRGRPAQVVRQRHVQSKRDGRGQNEQSRDSRAAPGNEQHRRQDNKNPDRPQPRPQPVRKQPRVVLARQMLAQMHGRAMILCRGQCDQPHGAVGGNEQEEQQPVGPDPRAGPGFIPAKVKCPARPPPAAASRRNARRPRESANTRAT